MGPRRKGGGINWEIGIDIYTLLCIKWLEKRKNKIQRSMANSPIATGYKDSWNQSGKEFGLGQGLL